MDYLRVVERASCEAGNPDGHALVAQEAAYLTNVAEGVAFSFVCRQPDCLFFGLNSQWVKKRTSEHFRCPRCGAFYKPSSTQVGGLCFVLQFPNAATGELVRIPTSWPPSSEQGWINKQIELQARMVTAEADVQAWHNKTVLDLDKLIAHQKIPAGFTRFVPSSDIDHRFDGQWGWTEFKARGEYWGSILPADTLELPIFNSWDTLIGLIANNTVAAQAVQDLNAL